MPNYTIRVYGLWINKEDESHLPDGQVLLSDERIGAQEFTKFPGGGMEKGEGTIDCLRREWREELDTEIEIISHFYTTDFYQASAFHIDTQVMSIYYLVKALPASSNIFSSVKNDFSYKNEREESFRFVAVGDLMEDDLTFPIDKHVVKMLKENARK